MQPEVPLSTETHECVSRLVELLVAGLGHGVAEEECRDGSGGAIHRMGGVACDVEEQLGVDLGDLHTEIGRQGLARDGGPLAERVMSHVPILLAQSLGRVATGPSERHRGEDDGLTAS